MREKCLNWSLIVGDIASYEFFNLDKALIP
jgi:hypothetical protein